MGNKEEIMKVCGIILEYYLNEINVNEKFVGMLKLQILSFEEKVMILQYLMLVLELFLLKVIIYK